MRLFQETFTVARSYIGGFDGVMPRIVHQRAEAGFTLCAAGQNLTGIPRGYEQFWLTRGDSALPPLFSQQHMASRIGGYHVEELECVDYWEPVPAPYEHDREPYFFSDRILTRRVEKRTFEKLVGEVVETFSGFGWRLAFAGYGPTAHFSHLWQLSDVGTVRALRYELSGLEVYAELQDNVDTEHQHLLSPTPYSPTHAPVGSR